MTSVVYSFPNGDRYEGECIQTDNDAVERADFGKHTTTSEGTWDKDKMNGKVVLIHPSHAFFFYEGDVVNNQFHGQGKYVLPGGSFYEGQFVENRLKGEGGGTFIDTESQVWAGMFHYKATSGLKFKLAMT